MPKVGKAIIVSKHRLGADTIVLDLEEPGIASEALPGQFVMVRGVRGTDPITPRPFSIMARLRDGDRFIGITLLIKILGHGTRAIDDLSVGEELVVTGPLGNHFEPDASREHLMVAGGTGIAPVAFAARELQRTGGVYSILYGGRGREDLHIDELNRIGLDVGTATEDGSHGFAGMVTEAMVKKLDESGADPLVFACGPWAMMKTCADICAERELRCFCSLERYMACGIGICLSCVFKLRTEEGYHTCCGDGPVVDCLEVDWDA